ncbi:hypothetical protein [Mycobacterium sp. 1164966.3]|nr:hypothetical protein [Mycobacterium sp. 1164966.3]
MVIFDLCTGRTGNVRIRGAGAIEEVIVAAGGGDDAVVVLVVLDAARG